MTENELREKVCRQAESWLGRKEADGSHREIIRVYNTIRPLPRDYQMRDEDPWCAAFVSAVGRACGLEDILFPECACDAMIARYRDAGRWMEDDGYRPQPGDLIFYDWQDTGFGDDTGSSDHVGLVLGLSGRVINIIEGNCGDSVMRTARELDGRYIRGFGLPDYGSKAEAESGVVRVPEAEEPEETDGEAARSESVCSVSLPVLRIGDESEAVRALQFLLIGRGFGCGPDGADGAFGPNTCRAVLRFQRRRGLPADGIVGPDTYRRLWLT